MRFFDLSLMLAGVVAVCVAAVSADDKVGSPLGFKMKSLTGKEVDLNDYKGKVVLMVNVASKCGLTPQYEELESLYEKYQDKGLVVLGFPCNQFGKQEPGSDAQIAEFCSETYKVKFPMFSKIDVNGEGAAPLYKYLTAVDAKPKGGGQHYLELREVHRGKERAGGGPVRAEDRAGREGSDGGDRRGTGEVTASLVQ